MKLYRAIVKDEENSRPYILAGKLFSGRKDYDDYIQEMLDFRSQRQKSSFNVIITDFGNPDIILVGFERLDLISLFDEE